jgi:hypothetical protein
MAVLEERHMKATNEFMQVFLEFPMKQMTYSNVDKNNNKLFAFVARDDKQVLYCHLLHADVTVCS